MSLSDWTISQETTSGINTVFESPVSPIEGSFSLESVHGGNGAKVVGLTSGMAVTTGLSRSIVMLTSESDSANVFRAVGCFGMMQSAILYNSNAYWAVVSGTATANPFLTTIGLYKGALSAFGGTYLVGTSITSNHNKDANIAVALKWQRDASTGHIILKGYVGVATDYSDLTLFASYTDSSSPYTSGVSGGIGARGAGGAQYFRYDDTDVFKAP